MSSPPPAEEMDVDQPAEDVPADDAPRRSSRKRKVPEKFVTESRPRAAKSGKDNQEEQDADEDDNEDEEDEDEDEEDSGDDVPEPRNAKKRKTATTNNDRPTTTATRGRGRASKPAATAATTAATTTGERRARGRPKGSTNATKAAGKSNAGRPKAATTKATTQGGAGDGEVKDDNGLFNALIQPDLALEQFVEGWVADYQTSSEEEEKIHVHELVVFFFRCCGVGCEIDVDDAIDLDHTGETMNDIHEEMNEHNETPIYPLLSRNKTYKPFRKNLETFISCLISHLARSPYLYTTVDSPPPTSGPTVPLITLLLNWLNPMSGSHYRAIRHTSTLIAMQLGTALCAEAKALEDQLAEAMRKRDAEGRKKKKDRVVVKNFEASIKELSRKKTVVNDYLKDIVLAFFVHRYRDRDPLIRADCLKEMGLFMKNYPEKFVNTEHLQYIDSGLTDLDPHARLEAIKALVPLYGPDTRITSMTTFTSRVVPRIIDMAVRDIDLRIRIQAINVLCQLDASGVLQDEEEEQRYHIACLIFDKEPRIRKAVGGLIKSMWEEQVEEMKTKDESEPVVAKKTKKGRGRPAANDEDEADEQDENDEQLIERDNRIGWKTLASLLMQLSNQLSASQRDEMADLAGSAEDTHTTQSQVQRAREVLSSVSQLTSALDTHASIAVEALWNEIPLVQDCETLLSFVAADQSVLEKEERPWALDDDEQTFLLKMVVTGVRKTIDHDKQKRKEDDETEAMEVQLTRNLIDTIPKLISKHQSDPIRVSIVLQLASLMSLPIYAEMRLTDAYERLWGDLIRQYLRHTDHIVLQQVLQLMRSLLGTADLKAVNETKLQEFKENLVQNVQESVGDIDVATSSLEEEQLHNIESAILRLRMVFPQMDIRDIFDGDAESEQTGLWETILALADRGKLGYREEVKLVEHAMKIMVWYLSWTAVKVTTEDVSSDISREKIESRRDETLRVLNEYAVGNHSNADEAVRREAVTDLLRFYVIFRPVESKEDTPLSPCQTVLSVSMDDSLQYRCAGTIQAAIDKFIEHIGGKQATREDDASSALSTVEDGEQGDLQKKKKQKQKPAPTPASIAYTAEFQTLIWSFISAMRAGVVESQHAGVLLKEYGRLDSAFDASLHVVAEILQDEGIYNQDGEMVSKVIGQALQESFEYHLDIATDPDPATTLGLAKLVSSAFFVHKSHFRLERRLPSENVVDFHEDGISWCIRKYTALNKSEKNVKDKTTKDRLRKREHACLSYFKILTLLTPALGGRDALKVKSRLTELLKDQKETVWPKAKGHDLINAYEKRLMSIASSDSAVKAASKAQIERDHQAEELNNDDQQGEDGLIVPAIAAGAAPLTPKRPQPVRRTRANAVQEDEPVHDTQEDEATDIPAPSGEERLEQQRNATHNETGTSPAADAEEGNADAEIDATSEGDQPATEVHVSPPPIAADLRESSPAGPASDDEAEAEPGRATRASSAVSFGDVQPTKRIRRR